MNEARRLLELTLKYLQTGAPAGGYDALTARIHQYLSKPEPPQEPTTPSERDRLAEIAWEKFLDDPRLRANTPKEIAEAAYRAADAFLKLKAGE